MPFIVNGVSGTLWSTGTRKTVTSICAMIAAIGGAIAAVKAESEDLEYVVPPSIHWVKEAQNETAKKALDAVKSQAETNKAAVVQVERVLHHIQLDQDNGKAEATDNDLFKAGLELKKASDDSTREYIQGQINKLQATKHRLDSQIDTLTKANPE